MIGVTGTDAKTSAPNILCAALAACLSLVGSLTTVAFCLVDEVEVKRSRPPRGP